MVKYLPLTLLLVSSVEDSVDQSRDAENVFAM